MGENPVREIIRFFCGQNSISGMGEAVREKVPVTYVVKRGERIRKFIGWKEEVKYDTDEKLHSCDCLGFLNTGKCKHLEFKELLDEFKVDEFIFFGDEIGECRPKDKDQILKIMKELHRTLERHFKFEELEPTDIVPFPADPNLYSCIRFVGKRKSKLLIVGYIHGIMFTVKPV